MPKTKFKRSMIASSRGNYVRHSHILYIKEELNKRNVEISIQEVMQIINPKRTRYFVLFLGKEIEITKEEAMKLSITFNIIER